MNKEWLTHLDNVVPDSGQGNRISAYTIGLEGWRRGLNLSFFSVFSDEGERRLRYRLQGYGRTHEFQLSMGDKVSQKAFDICNDKEETKKYLIRGNVPVPIGKVFYDDSNITEIVTYANSIEFPVVVKPTDSNAGKGVFANITDAQELEQIVNHVRFELWFSRIMVEKFVEGKECRVYVIENRVIAAMNRLPANLKGDGIHTIRELIRKKNKKRKLNPHLSRRLITLDEEINQILEDNSFNIDDVLEEDQVLFLREKSNLSTGGDAVDVTDDLHTNIAEIAINAGKSIPKLIHYGVDIIVNEEGDKGVVLEVNTRPGLGGHLFPGQGKARDVPKEIIDYYFPETKEIKINNFYYDFDSVMDALIKRTAKEIEIIENPQGEKYGRKYILESSLKKESLNKIILPKIRLHNLHGFIDYADSEGVKLIVSGNNFNKVELLTDFLYSIEKVIVVKVEQWDVPVKIGFDIIDDFTKKTKKQLRNLMRNESKLENISIDNRKLRGKLDETGKKLMNTEEQLKESNFKNIELEKKYHSIITSKSWKHTSIFRKLSTYIKKR